MTREREDAIYLLNNLIGRYGNPYDEALEMAINTLTKPDTFDINDEMITKRQAIDALDKRFDNIPMEQTAEILMLRKDLRELPTIQPEERTEKRTETHGVCLDAISRQAAIDEIEYVKAMKRTAGMTYTQHLLKNWRVAFHALNDFFAHFIHGLIPAIKIRHHQPYQEGKQDRCPHCGADMRGDNKDG